MQYSISGRATSKYAGAIIKGENKVKFGINTDPSLLSPVDLLLSAFASCCLKNIERFSEFMHFEYESAEIQVDGIRKEKPPMIEKINFSIQLNSNQEQINTDLLLRNLQKFGTIYNTLKVVCEIEGEIHLVKK